MELLHSARWVQDLHEQLSAGSLACSTSTRPQCTLIGPRHTFFAQIAPPRQTCALLKPPTAAASGVTREVMALVELALEPDAPPLVCPAPAESPAWPWTAAPVRTEPSVAVPVDSAVLIAMPAAGRRGTRE